MASPLSCFAFFCWEFNIGVCWLLDGSDALGDRGWPAGTGTLPYSMGPETEMGFIQIYPCFHPEYNCFTCQGRSGSEAPCFSNCCTFKLSQALAQLAFLIHGFQTSHHTPQRKGSKEQIFRMSHPSLGFKQ